MYYAESNAIGQYLASKKPASGLLPTDERARLDVTRWQFWDLAHRDPACTIFIFENVVKPESLMSTAMPTLPRPCVGAREAVPIRVRESARRATLRARDLLLADTLTTR